MDKEILAISLNLPTLPQFFPSTTLYHTVASVKLCSYITLQVFIKFTCGMEFSIWTTTSQPSHKVVTTLQGCEHFA